KTAPHGSSMAPNGSEMDGSDLTGDNTVVIPFEARSSFAIVGPTKSGKTYWVYKFLQQKLFDKDEPTKILYCYGAYQDLFLDMERNIPGIEFHEGLPTEQKLQAFADGQHQLVILDDVMTEMMKDSKIEQLFTQKVHHLNLSCVYLWQNLLPQGKTARTVALNTTYYVLFRHMRGLDQIKKLGQQLGMSKWMEDIYQDCLSKPYAYLVVDLSPTSDDRFRLRTNVFRGEDPIVYQKL
ncbi:MAG: hypothetical protein MJA29_01430, partial [Candidatus Omnitrophica bacterium]|nr:hypothetical protein [Candidatus Omnitrophota bacterium]